MTFIGRVHGITPRDEKHTGQRRVRLYIDESYIPKERAHEISVEQALGHTASLLWTDVSRNWERLRAADFFLGTMWINQGARVTEFFGYQGTDPWPGNPEVYSWILKEGLYQPTERNIACENTLRILGREGDYRRACASLDEYMQTPPDLGDEFGKLIDY